MNGVERQVRDLLLDDASHAPLVGHMPDRVRPRVRRRQTAMAVVAALTTLAVVAGVAVVMRSLEPVDRNQPVHVPDESLTNTRPVFQRTTTVGSFTVTSPSDWYLVDYWGAYNPDDPTALDGPAVPVLELTNFDPGLSTPVCDVGPGESTRLPADGVAILVTVGNGAADLCGGAVEASETGAIGAYPYQRVMAFGPDVTQEARATAEQSWRSMESINYTYYTRGQRPAYVLDGWADGSLNWLLEAGSSKTGVGLYAIAGMGDYGGSATLDARGSTQVQGETVGFVTQDAASVEYHRAGVATPLVGKVIDLPPSLASGVDAYVFEQQPTGGPSEVLAIGADGEVLGSNLPPLVATEKVGTVDAFGATWVVKSSTSADGYSGSTCVVPAGKESTLGPCERGWGGGTLVQTFDGPNPAVFVAQSVGSIVGSIDLYAEDGRVFHAVMLPSRNGGFVAVVALEGAGRGRFVFSLNDGRTDEGRRPEAQVAWPDVGQVVGGGSFPSPDTP